MGAASVGSFLFPLDLDSGSNRLASLAARVWQALPLLNMLLTADPSHPMLPALDSCSFRLLAFSLLFSDWLASQLLRRSNTGAPSELA